jgi:predicted DNA-binding transcriptional regulator AlpA
VVVNGCRKGLLRPPGATADEFHSMVRVTAGNRLEPLGARANIRVVLRMVALHAPGGHATAVSPPRSPARDRGVCMPATTDRHLSPQDLAAREGVPLGTVYTWNYLRTGPRYIRIGRSIRYRLTDVEAWEKSREVASSTGGAA